MSEFIHGGNIWAAQSEYGGSVLDFSANLNPFGMPESVRMAAERAVRDGEHYPDPHCVTLRAGIAAACGVEPEQILCGNGAADLIYRLIGVLRPRRALLTAPSFSEYGQALVQAGCMTERYLLRPEDSFDLGPDFTDRITDQMDLVVLCSPNNPTGRLVDQALLRQIGEKCHRLGVPLLLDECFLSMSEGKGMETYLNQWPELILLRAFTKSYAIPGLRLGYCLSSSRTVLERMALAGPPWSVSTVAQAAGVAALACPEWPERARMLLRTERPRLKKELERLGMEVIPGEANFLLFRSDRHGLKQDLMRLGILIRDCSNYEGLLPGWYRVCVGRREQNDRLLSAIGEALKWQKQS